MQLSEAQRRLVLNVACRAIRAALSGAEPPPVEPLPEPLPEASGCFVSLHDRRTHALRGCVGTMHGEGPLAAMVARTAVNTLGDPRFPGPAAVTLADLPSLEIEVSLLSPLQQARDPLDFDLLNDGIYLTVRGRSGVFLPQVARETGWPKEKLLARLCTEKMKLPPDAWRLPEVQLQVFRTLIVGPEGMEC